MNTQSPQALTPQQRSVILETMNQERADDLLLYAEVYAKQHGAKAARLVDLHADSMDLELEFLYSTPKRVNIRFSHPIEDATTAELHFDLLAKKAHELRGDDTGSSMRRTLFRMLPEWMKH
ncbi:DUF2470 domain-containing protein [Motiliproteus sp. SC1-56]|uniref:DUF2470 domain-containing protein n=1 Tax=Motiliproteus sp. SC1-56 TaxID=2799565 RepID=UPI001A8D5516|nr:DUF2470 domain-containing protein [Motiliproteus sp. SC1-56]